MKSFAPFEVYERCGSAFVRNLVAHAGSQREPAPVRELGLELALDAEEDVALHAPMVREVSRGVLDDAHADAPEGSRPPVRAPGLTFVLGRLDLAPVGRTEWNARHVHDWLLREMRFRA
jgi:hypothetical protein